MKDTLNQFIQDDIVDEDAVIQLKAYVKLFRQYNEHTNLSSVREENSIWEKHIADSLTLLKFEQVRGTLIDIGTGGGLPGIPLAIARKELEVLMLESVGKKVKACEHFIKELELKNARVLQARAERLGQDETYEDLYDVVVSRAVAYLPTILAWAEQFVTPSGRIILYKSPSPGELADGAAAATYLKLKLVNQHIYALGGKERQLLVYKKK